MHAVDLPDKLDKRMYKTHIWVLGRVEKTGKEEAYFQIERIISDPGNVLAGKKSKLKLNFRNNSFDNRKRYYGPGVMIFGNSELKKKRIYPTALLSIDSY
jgi:hypothetical protein